MAEDAPRIPTPADFVAQWQQAAQQVENQWNEYLNRVMGTEAYASMMSRQMESYLSFQQTLANNLERYFQSMNMPTRNDVIALGERLSEIESQLSALTAEQQRLNKRLRDSEEGGSRRGGRAAGNGA